MGKLVRSWHIFRQAMAVVMAEKKLLFFPLVSAVAMILLLLLIFGSLVTMAVLTGEAAEEPAEANAVEFLIFFVCYLLTMLLANFCNVAFFSEIFRGLNHEAVSVSRGFAFAASRFKAVLLWSLLASTVGVILNTLEQRAGVIGKIVLKITGAAWAVAACFAIPVLVFDLEVNNPFTALRRSAECIRKTWGESLIGFLGIHSVTAAAFILFLLFSAGMVVLSCTAGVNVCYLALPMTALALIALIAFTYLVSVAQHVYQAALYLYAQGELPDCFEKDDLCCAFKSEA